MLNAPLPVRRSIPLLTVTPPARPTRWRSISFRIRFAVSCLRGRQPPTAASTILWQLTVGLRAAHHIGTPSASLSCRSLVGRLHIPIQGVARDPKRGDNTAVGQAFDAKQTRGRATFG